MINDLGTPAVWSGVQTGHGQIVDPVGKDLKRCHPKRPLHLRQDGTEMTNYDQVRRRRAQVVIDPLSNPRCKAVPTFTTGWGDGSRLVPKGPDQLGVLGLDLGMTTHFPIAKMDLAQAVVMGEAVAAIGDGVCRRNRSTEVGRHDGRVWQVQRQSVQGGMIRKISRQIGPADHALCVGGAMPNKP